MNKNQKILHQIQLQELLQDPDFRRGTRNTVSNPEFWRRIIRQIRSNNPTIRIDDWEFTYIAGLLYGLDPNHPEIHLAIDTACEYIKTNPDHKKHYKNKKPWKIT